MIPEVGIQAGRLGMARRGGERQSQIKLDYCPSQHNIDYKVSQNH